MAVYIFKHAFPILASDQSQATQSIRRRRRRKKKRKREKRRGKPLLLFFILGVTNLLYILSYLQPFLDPMRPFLALSLLLLCLLLSHEAQGMQICISIYIYIHILWALELCPVLASYKIWVCNVVCFFCEGIRLDKMFMSSLGQQKQHVGEIFSVRLSFMKWDFFSSFIYLPVLMLKYLSLNAGSRWKCFDSREDSLQRWGALFRYHEEKSF